MAKKLVLVGMLVAIGGVYYDHMRSFTSKAPEMPREWWGEGNPKEDDQGVKPFKINFPKEDLDELYRRLKNTRPFQPPLDGIGFEYGFNTKFLQTVVEFWKTKYSWKDRQAYLNSFPQFTTEFEGLKIHFIRVAPAKTSGVKVIPLLLVHGWPGSVREFYEAIPLLTTPREGVKFVFKVIVPSLPGYGFSQSTSRPGLGTLQIAVIFLNLMAKLGFKQFLMQGGDWGSVVVTQMSQINPDVVIGVHTNMDFVMTT